MSESKRYQSERIRPETRVGVRKKYIDLWWDIPRYEEGNLVGGKYADPKERERSLSDIIKEHEAECAPYIAEDKIVLEEFGLAFEKGRYGEYRGRLKTPREYLPQTAGDGYAGGDVPGQWLPEDASKFFLLAALRAQKGEIKKFDVIVKEIQYMVLEKLDLADMSEAEAGEAAETVSQAVEEVMAESEKKHAGGESEADIAPEAVEGRFRAALKRSGLAGEKVLRYFGSMEDQWRRVAKIVAFGLLLKAGIPNIELGDKISHLKSAVSGARQFESPDEPEIQYPGLDEPKLYELLEGGADSLLAIAKTEILPNFGDEEADDTAIQLVAKSLAEDNNIAVPEWGVAGNLSHTQLKEGQRVMVGEHTKAILRTMGPNSADLVEKLYS